MFRKLLKGRRLCDSSNPSKVAECNSSITLPANTFPACSKTELMPRRLAATRLENPRDMVDQTALFEWLYKEGDEYDEYEDDDNDDNDEEESPRRSKVEKESKPEVLLVQGTHGMHYARQGLVGTILQAYSNHHNLHLRPDDVWITILAQFCAYVNGRSEALRSKFVSHDGTQELTVNGHGDIRSADFGWFIQAILDEIAEHLVDPSLREWFLPGFSTSTPEDDVCAAATAMCTLQKYFEYSVGLLCGIPQVTLLGTVEDWELLRTKIQQLGLYDTEDDTVISTTWLPLLQIICDNLVESAKNGSTNNMEFWETIASHEGMGSGTIYISGWVSVFTFFDKDGKVVGGWQTWYGEHKSQWPVVDTEEINPNVVSCPVKIDDNGTKYQSRLFAGQMSYDQLEDPTSEKTDKKKNKLAARKKISALKKKKKQTQKCKRMNLMPRNDWALVIEKNQNSLPQAS